MKKFLFLFVLFILTGFTVCESFDNSSAGEPGDEVWRTNSVVSLVRARASITDAAQFTYSDVKTLVAEAVELAGGFEGIVKYGDTVVLKPNLVTTYYNWGNTSVIPPLANGVYTDWRVVQATAELVREIIGPKGAEGSGKILVMEGSGSPGNATATVTNFINAGYNAVNLTAVDEIIALESEGAWVGAGVASGAQADYVTRVRLDNFRYRSAAGAYYTYYKNDGVYYVNKKMYEADALICIPVLKNHWHAVFTGSIKNISIGAAPPRIYGISRTNVGRNNMVNHNTISLHEWIADYFSCIPATFTIMDGLQGLERGPLPSAANARILANSHKNLRVILASKDALALDTVATNIINHNYTTVPYLVYLTERGQAGTNPNNQRVLLNGNPRNITVLGNVRVDDIRSNYAGALQSPFGAALTNAQLAKPSLTIQSAVFAGQDLKLNLVVSSNTIKADIYIGGKYAGSVRDNLNDITIDASKFADGAHEITVYSYTRFMAHAAASAAAVK
ncbi:MAG: DUF362 domain-containing protein [Treponema sp.]|nr:DUF362 domain-containing protein [Treponema sp.]